MSKEHQTVLREDYRPSSYFVEEIYLVFKLDHLQTNVTTTSKMYRNPEVPKEAKKLVLYGENLKLISISINGDGLDQSRYESDDEKLILHDPPESFSLEVVTEIDPENNTALSGLYRTSGNYCTQCEAQGFRRITYFLDRPDVLTRYTTRIEADSDQCPVMLSNGNLIEKGGLNNNRHYVIWHDPFPKPSYLFALVAGKLFCHRDDFTTVSGRKVALEIYVEQRNRHKTEHAMRSLKKAMKWDEDVFGLEYDLDIYMIVAVDDFNMGAMENKGLNIFNSKYVLASPETATDQDYLGIEGVIGHEYFHNWTGNRVTCRDWFQLSLKEGLTVFRDQQFSADMNSSATQRINDVRVLRNFQFREDSGPMAHPVRPDSYVEINNFYTVTVYNKGAEVIRMIHRLLGKEKFRLGMELYFSRFDGQAVTCDDFVEAMADASSVDLQQFKLWYSQSGTPVLEVAENWDEVNHTLSLQITQKSRQTPGQPQKKPFHIPVEIGLLLPSQSADGHNKGDGGEVARKIELREAKHEYIFNDIKIKPVVSFLRGFTAPVKVEIQQSREELAYLMAHDTDSFNRWDAANRLSIMVIMDVMSAFEQKKTPSLDGRYVEAFRHNLVSEADDTALIAQAMTLPSEMYIAQQVSEIDPAKIHRGVEFVKAEMARTLHTELQAAYYKNVDTAAYSITPEAMARRSLKNQCLSYLMAKEAVTGGSLKICMRQFDEKKNMTDVIAALVALANYSGAEGEKAFAIFYQDWKDDPLVLDKWFSIQATSSLPTTLTRVRQLTEHNAFSIKNPNKIRALIGTFCNLNHVCFHDESGAGYRFLTEYVLKIDNTNPQVAARLVSGFINYANYTQKLKVMMKEQLQFISMQKAISADVYEIVQKSLEAEQQK